MFTSVAMEHIRSPRGLSPLDRVTHRGSFGTEGDGPFMVISLFAEDGVVRHAGFKTYGCPASIICGSLVCELVTGRSLDKFGKLEAEDLIVILGGLPEGKEHCAAMAAAALKNALESEKETVN